MAIVRLLDPPKSLSLSETLLAMDIADTIRHDDRMREFEMTDGDRRRAAIERLRKAYEAQGDVVSDGVLERAIVKLDEDRFVHKTMGRGPRRLFWTGFVRRGRYSRNVAIAAAACAVVYGGWTVGYDQLVIKPRLEAERRLAIQMEVIPHNLASTVEYAEGVARRLRDDAAIERIDSQRKGVEAALAARDAEEAERGILTIRAVGQELKHREDGVRLVADADAMTSGPISKATDADARAALVDIASQMRDAALRGDLASYSKAADRFKSFAGYILTPYKIQIVDRHGTPAGVEVTHNESGSKAWYQVVEAVSPSGTVYPLEIRDRQTGKTKPVSVWAIRISYDVFIKGKKDKQSDGVIDDNIVGTKPAGTMKINWNFETDGQTLNEWPAPKQAGRNR
ncbi:hypothetical protein HFO56_33260 [Rhizobium laguerreae]|uniref:DUF6384 family protein n=1 Tax=Rhizobium laguerreae TaxID=1076926 RepID=UPI001C91E506|nr:DUF6384 family protein [Rhizobium laguerreae]MBY3157195.1 hypothetical protein [Rhizobium laguerreae]